MEYAGKVSHFPRLESKCRERLALHAESLNTRVLKKQNNKNIPGYISMLLASVHLLHLHISSSWLFSRYDQVNFRRPSNRATIEKFAAVGDKALFSRVINDGDKYARAATPFFSRVRRIGDRVLARRADTKKSVVPPWNLFHHRPHEFALLRENCPSFRTSYEKRPPAFRRRASVHRSFPSRCLLSREFRRTHRHVRLDQPTPCLVTDKQMF